MKVPPLWSCGLGPLLRLHRGFERRSYGGFTESSWFWEVVGGEGGAENAERGRIYRLNTRPEIMLCMVCLTCFRFCWRLENYSYQLGTAPLSNSGTRMIIGLYIALNRTPITDCYWVGGVPNISVCAGMLKN